ncbi:MAG: DHHA1 domain-containing protein [Nanoarchaeota archaeon]
MLTSQQITSLQEELLNSKNPLFLYDSDADGLASFLLLYRMHREGKGIRVTSISNLNLDFVKRIKELNPDKIFILDIPVLDQQFVDELKRPVFWLDHHEPQLLQGVNYFNPRIADPDAYIPTTRMAYQVSQNPEDLWIAAIGCLADWHMPDFIEEFIEKYPGFLSKKTDLTTALYKEPVGKLVKLFFFLQKGPSNEVRKSISVLMKMHSPQEIFNQETAAGKFLYKRFDSINSRYESILSHAKEKVTKSKILIYTYSSEQWSFTTNLANELSALYPKKVIIIARKKSGEMKCSIRAQFRIVTALEHALVGIKGYGGGHPNACGAVIKEEDWDLFINRFKEELKHGIDA